MPSSRTMAITGAVHHRAEHDGNQPVLKAARSEKHFTDNDRRQADDDSAGTHTHVGKAVALGNEGAGKGDQTVRDKQSENDHDVGVDALRTGHLRVAAGGTNSSTQHSAEEPIHDHTDYCRCD